MTTLSLPVQPPMWELAHFRVPRSELHSRIGAPHFTETDSSRTFGGAEDCWAFVSATGQRIMLLLRVPYEEAAVLADPPDVTAALSALALAISDSPVTQLDRAYPYT